VVLVFVRRHQCFALAPIALVGLAMLASAIVGVQARAGQSASVRAEAPAPANGASDAAAISAGGRFVAFYSYATNLVAGRTLSTGEVFVRDRVARKTELVSVSTGGAQANELVGFPAISANGRFVAFDSFATNLLAGDSAGCYGWRSEEPCDQVWLRDRRAHSTERVSVGSGGTQANDESFGPVISADGHFVAFYSFATNLVADDTNFPGQNFLRDRVARTTELFPVGNTGAWPGSDTFVRSISADGRVVAFESPASDLVAGDTNGTSDAFVYDRALATTTRVSVSSSGVQANGVSGDPAISADGRFVAFTSDASNLVAGVPDTRHCTDFGVYHNCYDVFVRDLVRGTTKRVSLSSRGGEANADSWIGAVSTNGRFVALASRASNLVAGDTNHHEDVFVRDLTRGTTERVSVSNSGIQANSDSRSPAISADGRFVAFESWASNLVAGDTNGKLDVFVRDRATGTTTLVSSGRR